MADAFGQIINPGFGIGNAWSATLFALDAATDAVEWIFQATEATTITRVGFRYGARTGTPPTYTISLQGVDASGNPDGVIKGGGSPASVAFTPPADATIDGLWQWKTLANPYACGNGEILALVIARTSGTIDASNNSTFTTNDTMTAYAGADGLPYAIQNNATVRTRQITRAVFAYSSATKIYGQPSQAGFSNAALTQASTPDELATRFVLPRGWGQTYKLRGVVVRVILGAAKTLKVMLYSGTTVIATATIDTDATATAANTRICKFRFQDATLPTLSFGTEYRIGFQPQDAAGAYTFTGVTQASNDEWGAYSLGTDWYMSSRTDLGAWSDDTTTRLFCELILGDITRPAPGLVVGTG